MNMIIKDTSVKALAAARPSVLGESQARIPIAGRIRSGIKVLIRKHENPNTQAVYNRGVAAGASFDRIDRAIIERCKIKDARTVLTPKNVPYFTVRPGDFTVPEMARKLFDLYASDGEHGRQLYRFPVIFPMDNWQAVVPHDFSCYTAGERRFWSQYGNDGQRFCMTHAPVEMEDKVVRGKTIRQAHRPGGGRANVLRDARDGLCVPDECPEYQARECALSGRVIFYVPGLPGTSAFELPTRSFYSLNQIRQTLEMVAFVTGGRISGVFNGEPIFYLTKQEQEVSMIDPATGKAKRVRQFLIQLGSTLDMTRMYQAAEAPARLAAGAQAAAALSGPAVATATAEAFDGADLSELFTAEDAAEMAIDQDVEFDPFTGEVLSDQPPPDIAAAAEQKNSPSPATENSGAPLTLEEMLAAVAKAQSVDEVNEALDLSRGLNDAGVAQARKAAGARVKVLAAGGAA